MVSLSTFDAKVIADFLEANYEAFQQHLEEREIEGTEAELIVNNLQKE